MNSTVMHICLDTDGAPDPTSEFEVGARWVCSCGGNFVYHGGFNRGGGYTNDWFTAPAIPRQRGPLSSLIFGPRKG